MGRKIKAIPVHPFEQLCIQADWNDEDFSVITIPKPLRKLEIQRQKEQCEVEKKKNEKQAPSPKTSKLPLSSTTIVLRHKRSKRDKSKKKGSMNSPSGEKANIQEILKKVNREKKNKNSCPTSWPASYTRPSEAAHIPCRSRDKLQEGLSSSFAEKRIS